MFKSKTWLILLFINILSCNANFDNNVNALRNKDLSPQRNLFDQDLYDDSLDPDLCDKQLSLILANTTFALPFLDAGFRVPRGILEGNLVDLGNYHQCLAIRQNIEDTPQSREILTSDVPMLSSMAVTVALCIPKACSTHQALSAVAASLDFTEDYCRLPGDKPTAPVDYVAICVFSVIGALVLFSTCYDLLYVFLYKKDPKEKSTLYICFSVYTNTQRLLTFKAGADSLDCLDGIRAISIIWVIVGHTHSTATEFPIQNLLRISEWIQSYNSLWIMAAPLSVDTFFMMSGLLCVYTVAKKGTRRSFLKNLPLFYLHRYLRMFPLLAAAILLQASLAHHVADGPFWSTVAREVDSCRQSWWIALLHLQNYVSGPICLGQTWYLSVDMQLYWISPLVLVWLCAPGRGGGRRAGWCAVTLAVLTSLLAATIYCFLNDFPFHPISNTGNVGRYMQDYYINTLTRAPPFFIGLVFGYALHLWRDTKIELSKILVGILWTLAGALTSFAVFVHYPILQSDYDNQLLDNFLNSYMRSFWAIGVGWLVFACKHGYGGPINWFLSLRLWKLPARLSYAMYLLHMSAMIIINSMQLSPFYFTQWNLIFTFFADMVLAILLAVVLTLAVDAPFSTLQKMLFEGGAKKSNQSSPLQNNNVQIIDAYKDQDLESYK
ncbi:Nose resistant to fluoxetine protein 6 [Eumeta japonica]|uniref:Nose resistant to fluoxetine protein 6 n=1 Tax=Eumeta variegata TaxID=151549 RepID=A0A4C1U286_EUMVA|nr:Nose resistant to fluoxetine protein 6 [Eumeta japonica]